MLVVLPKDGVYGLLNLDIFQGVRLCYHQLPLLW